MEGICRYERGFGISWAQVTYVFNQSALVLEGVTLAKMVQFMIEMLVDFA